MDNPVDKENGPTVTKWCNHHCHLPPTSFPKFNDSVTMYLFPQSLSKSHFLPSPPSPPNTKLPLSFMSNYLLPIYTACYSSSSFSTLEPKWSTGDKSWISLCFSLSLGLSHHHRHHHLSLFYWLPITQKASLCEWQGPVYFGPYLFLYTKFASII